MTPLLTYPVLALLFIFGVLVITATPVSEVFSRMSTVFRWVFDKSAKGVRRVSEDFEISESEPFETPLVADWHHRDNEAEDLEEELVRALYAQRALEEQISPYKPQSSAPGVLIQSFIDSKKKVQGIEMEIRRLRYSF
jgi:S-DNA-T family DNA segregation ATPase FtsK/SpoIIIE